jgi:tripartite-type tricarboxylate transporter receptor subunit TctC
MQKIVLKHIFAPTSWLYGGLLMAGCAWPALAQYPAKAVRLVVPFPAGGGIDVTARILAQQLTTRTGQSFIVENRAGAAGIIGTEFVAKSAADGYTLLVGSQTTQAVVPAMYKVNYNTARDFVSVSAIADSPMVLLVHPQLPAHSTKELVALAKDRPGQITFGSAPGATPHIGTELLKQMGKIDLMLIPYKGESPALQDLMGGQIMMMLSNLPVSMPHLKGGRLRPLAVSSTARAPTLPDLPTIAESGVPGYEYATWFGFFAPTGVPREILNKLSTEAAAGLNAPEVRSRMANQGYFVTAGNIEKFSAFVAKEIPRWAQFVKSANIKGE